MQAKTYHSTIPPKLPPPAKIPPPGKHNISLPSNVPRAISITAPPTPSHEVPILDVDDTVTAYWDYQFLFVSQRAEAAEPINLRLVEGEIPLDFPSGTYYLTGPGLFSDDHGSTVHPLDGHGYLRAFTIDGTNGQVKFMARYIQTEAQSEERDPVTGKWRFTHRGPFSVLKGGKMVGNTKVMKNVANTSVLRWGGRLFCLWEGGDPYELESGTLDTVGKFDVIKDDREKMSDVGGLKVDVWDVAAEILKPILYGKYKS
ncbi:carotenoid cleavage dioxygenase 7 [Forsythia ovata]|uniref:Carotenoid cleavage dioxygenase 7 n=1 Tax=Forsythia ovata TaxID=205694 RepID=A0ABD1VJH9_9LAMI